MCVGSRVYAVGVFIRGDEGMPYGDPAAGAVHFDHADWLVEWEDGQLTRPNRAWGLNAQRDSAASTQALAECESMSAFPTYEPGDRAL